MSVFNGNIFVLVDIAGFAPVTLLSDKLYLSDAALHSAMLDFTASGR